MNSCSYIFSSASRRAFSLKIIKEKIRLPLSAVFKVGFLSAFEISKATANNSTLDKVL